MDNNIVLEEDEDEFLPDIPEEVEPEDEEVELDELSKEFVNKLIDRCIEFMNALVGHELHPYQMPLARRIIESVLINDGEEIAAVSSRREVLRSREKVTLDGIVRFIKVNAVNVDVRLLKTGQRVIGSEDQLLAICLLRPVVNNSRASAAEVMSLTTMNVHHSNISVKFKKLSRELLGKQDTRSNYNNDSSIISIQIIKRILDHAHSLTTARRNDDLTLLKRQHSVSSILLVGTELHHFLIDDRLIIARRGLYR